MSLADEARTVRNRIAARLQELEPLVREYNELTQLAAEMGLERPQESADATPLEAPRKPATDSSPRPRRSSGSAPVLETVAVPAELTDRVLEAVRADPGRTVSEYAEGLDVSPSALYRPVRKLTGEGILVKRARQLFTTQ